MTRLKLNADITENNITEFLNEAERRAKSVDLSDCDLRSLNGTTTFLGKKVFSYSNLMGAKSSADFSGTSFARAKLRNATFKNATFAMSDFTEADIANTNFSFAKLESAIGLETAKNLGKANFYCAKLSEAQKAAILKANPKMDFGH
jgi:uncharacterized protein YjbI with pentapeptide repeats